MRLDALLIEPEGILLETRDARLHALASALAATGSSAGAAGADETLATLAEHGSFSEAIRAARPALDETDVELATLRAERALDDALGRLTVLVPGAREALTALATRVRIGVVTRLPRRIAERVLAVAELEPVVFTLVAAEDGGSDPTAPGAYARALARLARIRATPADAVAALVPAAGAIEAARAAGLRVVCVGGALARGSRADGRVASIAGVTYDALVQLLERSGVRPT